MLRFSFVIPINLIIGFAINREDEPVMLNTKSIISICQLDFIPQRSFRLLMHIN